MLIGACRAPVQGVPHKYHVLFPREIRELYLLFFLVQQREIRCRLSYRDTHNLPSYVSHISLSILPNPFVSHQVPSGHSCCPRKQPCALISFRLLVSGSTLCSGDPMSAQATGRALIMLLRDLVRLYRSLAGKFGEAVALSGFGLTKAETERLFSGYDEDYHISRFFQFSETIDAEIQTIL